MTDERVALLELIEKGADADLVRELLAYASDRLMAVEIDQLTGAAAGARSPDRVNYRNGYRERGWETRVGRIELAIPKLRPSPSADGVACGIGIGGGLAAAPLPHHRAYGSVHGGSLDKRCLVPTRVGRAQ